MSLPELIPSDLPVFIRKALRSHFANSVIPQGSSLLFAQSDSNGGVRFITKNSDGSYTNVGGGGSADVILGVVDSAGKFQPLKFSGTEASESGEPIIVENYKTWNSTYPTPDPTPASSMNFYKCFSVDTYNSNWGGHLAVISDSTGIWYFSSDSTNLVYDRITPVVGHVYDENATFEVKNYKTSIPTSGLVFYAPLVNSQAFAETGQTLTESGVSFTTVDGIQCMTGNITFSYEDFPSGNSPFSVSAWIKGPAYAILYGRQSNYSLILFGANNGNIMFAMYNFDQSISSNLSMWHHIVGTYENGVSKLYIDGTLAGTKSIAGSLTIPASPNEHSIQSSGQYTAAVRVYNRALTEEEITSLFEELSPMMSQ